VLPNTDTAILPKMREGLEIVLTQSMAAPPPITEETRPTGMLQLSFVAKVSQQPSNEVTIWKNPAFSLLEIEKCLALVFKA
jgi:hypothetical protein